MKQVLRVTIDPEWPIGTVSYRSDEDYDGASVLRREADGRIRTDSLEDVGFAESGVMIHETSTDQLIEVEILDVDDPEMVALARDYARAEGLELPADLRAAAKAFV